MLIPNDKHITPANAPLIISFIRKISIFSDKLAIRGNITVPNAVVKQT